MEKENFLGKLRKLVELAKSKQNALDVTEINNFFMGDNLQTEQMEQIYSFPYAISGSPLFTPRLKV
mgnify:CR=1 FL=1